MIKASSLFNPEIFRFVAVGLFNTVFGYSIYAIGIAIGLDYRVANLVSLIVAILVAFIAGGRWVFKRPEPQRLPRFLLMWAGLWTLNVSMIGWLLPHVGGNAYLAGALTLIVAVPLSYLIQKYFVFGGKSLQ
jgi:putative flippase GtrA